MEFKLKRSVETSKQGKKYKIVYIDPNESEIKIYPHTSILKKYGAKWNNLKKVWFWFYNDENYEDIKENNIKPALREILKIEKKPTDEVDEYLDAAEELINSLENIQSNVLPKEDEIKIRKSLEDLRNEIVNIDNDEEFKKTMKIVQSFRSIKDHGYSLYNSMLILLQDRKATWVKSRSVWKMFNRVVNKEAPIIWLVKPKHMRSKLSKTEREKIKKDFYKKHNLNPQDTLKDKPGLKHKLNIELGLIFKNSFEWYPTYDVRFTTQIEGKKDYYEEFKKKEDVKWAEDDLIDEKVRPIYNALIDFAHSKDIKIDMSDDLGGAKGVSKSGSIEVLKNEGNDVGLTKTLAHEIAHELLHQTYVKSKDPDFEQFFIGKDSRGVVEQQAEIAAWMVMASYGFDLKTTSINYALLWGGDKESMLKVFDTVTNVVNLMIKHINDYLKKQNNDNNTPLSEEENVNIHPAKYITPDEMAKFLGVENQYQQAKKDSEQQTKLVENFYKILNNSKKIL